MYFLLRMGTDQESLVQFRVCELGGPCTKPQTQQLPKLVQTTYR